MNVSPHVCVTLQAKQVIQYIYKVRRLQRVCERSFCRYSGGRVPFLSLTNWSFSCVWKRSYSISDVHVRGYLLSEIVSLKMTTSWTIHSEVIQRAFISSASLFSHFKKTKREMLGWVMLALYLNVPLLKYQTLSCEVLTSSGTLFAQMYRDRWIF